MTKAKKKVCRHCKEVFLSEKPKEKFCNECRMLRLLKHCKDLRLVEIQRKQYNERHGLSLTYGQFVGMLEDINND